MLLPKCPFQNSMDFLEYPSVSAEVRGAMVEGNLRITDTEVVFKHGKTGKKDVVKVRKLHLKNEKLKLAPFFY